MNYKELATNKSNCIESIRKQLKSLRKAKGRFKGKLHEIEQQQIDFCKESKKIIKDTCFVFDCNESDINSILQIYELGVINYDLLKLNLNYD